MARTVIALAGLIAGLLLLGLCIGEQALAPGDIVSVLAGREADFPGAAMIVFDIRLPRLALALLVGMALGLSGAIAQVLMNNPLAEPGLIGINAGAALAALTVMVTLQMTAPSVLAAAAFCGGLAAALAIYVLSWKNGGAHSLRIILIGIGISALCSAAANFITVFGEIASVQQAQVWLAGSLYLADWQECAVIFVVAAPAGAVVLMLARELDLIALGEETAAGLGQPVQSMRALLMLLCVLISAAAVSVSGLIAFVGLIAPHIARRLTGSRSADMLPVAALAGGAMLLAADLIARTAMAPAQLPAGLVTAIVGTPAFAFVFWRSRHGTAA